MKMLNHPNIVNLIEVIDDPSTDHFYMGIYCHFLSLLCMHFFPSNYVIKYVNLFLHEDFTF